MRRVLVPLDGTDLAASILPDARRLAGRDGCLILVRSLSGPQYDPDTRCWSESYAAERIETYLQNQALLFGAEGVQVETHMLAGDATQAIDEAARLYHADMIACATHGRGPVGRLFHGGVAWKALAHSPVPMLLRQPGTEVNNPAPRAARRIMVPLDGSTFAEQAVPLAQKLASEWNASLWLVRIVPMMNVPAAPYAYAVTSSEYQAEEDEAQQYLGQIAAGVNGEVHTEVFFGAPVADQLAFVAWQLSITDVVMSSHGRTGLSRAIVGSVADALIHKLHLPIIVAPSLAGQSTNRARRDEMLEGAVSSARS